MGKEREVLDVDALFVGAGPACLAGAIHLARLIRAKNAEREKSAAAPKELFVAVIEKAKEPGAHVLSGAVLDPSVLAELVPDFASKGCPLEGPVGDDDLFFLTPRGKVRVPFTPAPLRNHGNHVISLGEFTRWLAGIAEEEGVEIFPTFPGDELLWEGENVAGVRTADKGIDKEGRERPNYQPGADFRAKATVLGEGTRGSLAKKLFAKRPDLTEGRNPQVYGIGVKEVWRVAEGRIAPGRVIHTLGHPLAKDTYGGGWIYGMANGLVSIGLVVGLDYRDPFLDPHERFQEWKKHPLLRGILEGGSLEGYGAKSMPLGGYFAVPKLSLGGAVLVGDTASLLNPFKLKGIHLAMRSGMLAAGAIAEALFEDDFSSASLARYDAAFEASGARRELYSARNFHQGFDNGLWTGLLHAGLQIMTGGRGVRERMEAGPGHERMRSVADHYGGPRKPPEPPAFDNQYVFDKLTDLFKSGTEHPEDQPAHLKIREPDICVSRCVSQYGAPCERFCPASVYHMEWEGEKPKGIRIDFSNCVHCKTCDIMDPYQVIDWTTPEGGGGPDYRKM
ncbi:MAG: electron transfer flavoprotein-ubiquinone oxidoreductase [Candidatus Eisenbacteria bacterium]